jgi:hypothetical protein
VASRPPAEYELAWKGRYNELWQRPPGTSNVLAHLPAGTTFDPGGTPSCERILELARTPGATRLATVERTRPAAVIEPGRTTLPDGWRRDRGNAGIVYPTSAGTINTTFTIDRPGRYTLWAGSSFRSRLAAIVDGQEIGALRHQLEESASYVPLGSVDLTAGTHRLSLEYDGPDLHPGSGWTPLPLEPLVVAGETADRPVEYVTPAEAASLCDRHVDWVEALSG